MPRRVAERGGDRLAERDAEIFDGVMLIDVEVACRVDGQVERAVAREQLQHVIEETDAGADLVLALAVEVDLHRDRRLGRPSIDYRAPHRTSSIAAMPRCVWST